MNTSAQSRALISQEEVTAPISASRYAVGNILLRQRADCIAMDHEGAPGGALAGFPDVLAVEDVALILGLSQSTIRVLLNQGQLPGVRLGRKWFIPRVRLAELLGVS